MNAPLAPLVAWYRRVKRPMPWRLKPAPYACWLSEIMLQQTTYEQALPYYTRFLATFPTVESLAAASEAAVLKAWEGLGYYARARNLLKAAQQIIASGWPRSAAEWRALPGVGPYTAAALASVLSGERVAVVDGNVARVFARYWRLKDDFSKLPQRAQLAARLTDAMCGKPGDFNQAMMELGQCVCTPTSPACAKCPLHSSCASYAADCVADYPVKTPRKALPVREAAAVVLTDSAGKVLLVQNQAGKLLKGLWDLPRLEPSDAYEQTFTHFKLVLSVNRVSAAGVYVDPRQVPLTNAAKCILKRMGILA